MMHAAIEAIVEMKFSGMKAVVEVRGVRWGSTNTTTHITASICWRKTRIIV